MDFEWHSGERVFKYKDSLLVIKIKEKYEKIKNEHKDILDKIVEEFTLATKDYQAKERYASARSINIERHLAGLKKVEEMLGYKQTELSDLIPKLNN